MEFIQVPNDKLYIGVLRKGGCHFEDLHSCIYNADPPSWTWPARPSARDSLCRYMLDDGGAWSTGCTRVAF